LMGGSFQQGSRLAWVMDSDIQSIYIYIQASFSRAVGPWPCIAQTN
jgi:hypothetical protein